MKKLLSVILSCAMIMSFFCVVPASAASWSSPYLFADFENSVQIFSSNAGGSLQAEIVDSGNASHGKVAQLTFGDPGKKFNTKLNYGGYELAPSINIGDKITFSMWIKSSTKLSNANFSIISMAMSDYEGTLSNGAHQLWTIPFDKNSTEWQYVTKTFTSTFAISKAPAFHYRMDDFSVANTPADSSVTQVVYQIDNFEFKIEKANQKTEKTQHYVENIAVTDSESTTGLTVTKGASDVVSVVDGTASDAAPAGNKYIRIDHKTQATLGLDIELNDYLKSNHIYYVQFKTRGTELSNSTLNGTVDYGYRSMVYQLRYDIDDVASANPKATFTDSPNGSAVAGTILTSSGINGQIYKNFTYYNRSSTIVNDGITNYNPEYFANWYTITILILSDKFNVEENLSSTKNIRINFWLYDQNGKGLGKFDFDDIKVLDLGPVANGGFDYSVLYEAGYNTEYLYNGNSSNVNNKQAMGWHFDSGVTDWYATTKGSSAYTFLAGAALPSEQATGQFGILYGQYTSDAQMYKYVPMYAGNRYEIKGYVRGASTTKGRARLVVDYTGETTDKEIYDVSTLGTNGIIYGDWVEFSGAYMPIKVRVDLTNIGLIAGKTETAGIMPRTPKVYVDFDEEWEGNVNAPNTLDHSVYMDGFAMTYLASPEYPSVTVNSATMDSDGVVTADYTFSTYDNVASTVDASVYKLVANGRYYGTFYDRNSIVVPEAAREAEGLSLEIIPITSTGYIGDVVTVDIEMPEIPEPKPVITLTHEGGDVIITTDTALVNAKLIFVSYDGNGKMVECDIREPINLEANTSDVLGSAWTLSAATYKAMLWADFATCKPIATAIEW